ncbi:MAG: 5-oxoprolinase subunit PxpA [Trueperaceae bacterium]
MSHATSTPSASHAMTDAGTAPITIDLNADAGESFGRWTVCDEPALFPHLTSVNLACGFHAGDPQNMLRSIALANQHGVAIGAHPGHPDKVGFGRREIRLSTEELEADILYQLSALAGLLRVSGAGMHHVKVHGALYFQMMRDEDTARTVAGAVARFDASLPLVVLAGAGGDVMRAATRDAGLRAVNEAFPDRAYTKDGRLAPRDVPEAMIVKPERIAQRAVAMARGEPFEAIDGGQVVVEAETLCLHGDGATAPQAARAVRLALEASGVHLKAF